MSPARRSRAPQRRSPLLVLWLCLAILLPALPMQPAAASPGADQPEELSAQDAPEPLIAFLRQGNLWLMNEDGSDQRQITESESPVEDFSWSPSGRYIVFQHGGRHRLQGEIAETDLVTGLFDSSTGEVSEVGRIPSNMAMSVGGSNLPVWALDADELLLLDFDPEEGQTYPLTRLGFDGTPTVLATFEEPYICGGPDGPFSTARQLVFLQQGGPWTRRVYDPVIWRTSDPIAYVRLECGQARTVDLAAGTTAVFPHRPLTSIDGQILVQGEGTSWGTPSLLDPTTGSLQPVFEGDVFAPGPDEAIYFIRSVEGQQSTFSSRFDDPSSGSATDNTVELWRTDVAASEPTLITSIPAFGAGMPRVTADGSAVVFGIVDNPTDMIGIDESGVESYTPDIYAGHLQAVHVDIATGNVTILSDNAILPKPQPSASMESTPSDGGQEPIQPTDDAPAVEITPTEGTDHPVDASSDGWIAYVGEDGNIWLMQPDGSQQRQVTTDGTMESGLPTYDMPAWSHDGSMLTFMEYVYGNRPGGIWVLREGTLTLLPNTGSPCFGPAFSADNQRVLYSCQQSFNLGDPAPPDLATNPLLGFVSSSALDGSDQRIEVPYTTDGSGIDWTSDGKAMHYGRRVDVRPSDGLIMVVYSGFHKAGVHLFAPDGTLNGSFDLYNDEQWLGPYDAHLTADGETIIATVCTSGCMPPYETPIHNVLLLDLDGNLLGRWSESGAGRISAGVDMAPDGLRVVTAFRDGPVSDETIFVIQESMAQTAIGVGSQPAWQPIPAEIAIPAVTSQELPIGSADDTSTSDPSTQESGQAGLRLEPGSDWIAYVGEDSNIWLMQPDGSQQTQITTDGTSDAPYVWPTWAHDGTMLVFSRRPANDSSESLTIHLFRDGVVSQVPNIHGCRAAAFMPGDQQLVLGCGSDFISSSVPDSALQTDPSLGFVSMANLDGTDWRVHVPYHRASDGVWPNPDGGPDLAWVESMSVHPDGPVLLSFSGPHGHGLALLDPGSTTPVVHRSPLGRGGVVGRFFPGSSEILIGACKGCYPRANSGDPEFTVAWMDRGGAITTTLYVPDPMQEMGMPTISPDGGTLMFSTKRSIHALDLNTGVEVEIAAGTGVTWQPNSGVVMARPTSAVTVGSASNGQLIPTQTSSDTVPGEFLGTWDGRGTQVNPSVEWPVTIDLTGGGEGAVVGTSAYPNDGCGGNLVLQDATADTIVLVENLAYGLDACTDGGTITLGLIDDSTMSFEWAGIRRDGSSSSATGTLHRPDGATGSSAPSSGQATTQTGDQSDGPVVDTTQLHPWYIGTFSGTGEQENPDSEWPITVTFTGGLPGEVVGTVEYPTLGCGGELVLVSINPNDEWLGFKATERITYGHDNCIDGGTFAFSNESAVGIIFGWTSPDSATTARGNLPRVEPGAASVPASDEGPAVVSTGAVEQPAGQEPQGGGGPPSIYDAPSEEEIVPIEPDPEGG